MNEKLRPLSSYMGGKSQFSEWIVDHFPTTIQLDKVIEPFGGMANILIECINRNYRIKGDFVYNDLNNDIYNIFKQVREHTDELADYLSLTPNGRYPYKEICAKFFNREFKDDIERAGMTLYLLVNGVNSYLHKKNDVPGISLAQHGASEKKRAFRYRNKVHLIHQFCDQFTNVFLENLDYHKLLSKYDKPSVLHYCDPPYLGVQDYYRTGWVFRDHYELAKTLNSVQGFVCLSYYPHVELKSLYPPEKWFYDTLEITKSSAQVHLSDRPIVEELLIMNYDWRKYTHKSTKSLGDAFQ